MEFIQCPLNAHSRSVFSQPEGGGDFGESAVFKKTQEHGIAIALTQFVECAIKHRTDPIPIDGRFR